MASATIARRSPGVAGRRWSTRRNCSRCRRPELTVLVGGLRVLGANHGGNKAGVFTTPGPVDQ